MDIREKALAGIIAIILLFLVLLISVSSLVMFRNYEELESSQVTCYIDLVVSNIRSEMTYLSTLVKTWSESDDTYAFAEGKRPGFVATDLPDRLFSRYDINALIITNARGEILFAQGYDYNTGTTEPVPQSVISVITSPGCPLMDLSSEGYVGFLNVPEKSGPSFFASSPILHSDQSGPPKGIVIIGKYIYADELDKFRSQAIPTLTITTVKPEEIPASGTGGIHPLAESPVRINPISEGYIQGETLLEDYSGVESVGITIEIPRTLHTQGKAALLSFLLFELATGLVLGLFIILLLDRVVLTRLLSISSDINAITRSGKISGRIKITRRDEISRLEDAVNLLLAHVEEAQARHNESEQKLHRAETVAKFGHWEFQMDTGTVTASAGARLIYGLENRNYTIPEIQKIPLPQYREYLDAALRSLIEEGKSYNTEFSIRRPSDNATVTIRSIAEYDPARKVVFGVIQDITEQKRAETDLKESEERYRHLTDNLPELVLVHRNGILLYANEAVSRASGISRADLVGRSIFEFIDPKSREIIVSRSRQRAHDDPGEPFEAVFLTKNGQKKYGIANSARIGYKGEPAFLVIITDISTRKAMEEALSVANRKLHMLSSITRHDIRNKILGLRSYIAIAMMTAHNEAEIRLFRQLEDSARTIDEQIEFTREYQTMGMNTPQWLPVKEVISRVNIQINPGNIKVLDESGELEIFADCLLDKVFYNLFDNAVRYGEILTEIHIYYQLENDSLTLVFEDNGTGIPSEGKNDIFERGFGKNTGLGLFMIREILAITGITIRETGIPGKGAKFEIRIPAGKFRFTGSADTSS